MRYVALVLLVGCMPVTAPLYEPGDEPFVPHTVIPEPPVPTDQGGNWTHQPREVPTNPWDAGWTYQP